jgi:hypothetical protein
MKYKFNCNRYSHVIHILDEYTGECYCKRERSTSGKNLNRVVDEFPKGRRICNECDWLFHQQQNDVIYTVPDGHGSFTARWLKPEEVGTWPAK